jgi:hypothetical protein
VVMLGHRKAPPDDIERRVSVRMTRQEVLTRADPAQLWVVVDEAVLRRPIGGPNVMRGQITAMIEATKQPHIRLQVIPFHAGGHAAAGGAFTILRFADQELPDVVFMEQLTSALYLDKREDVDHYAAAMERLVIEAEPPSRTAEILDKTLRDLGARYR